MQMNKTHSEIVGQLAPILANSGVAQEIQDALIATFTSVIEKRLSELSDELTATFDAQKKHLEANADELIKQAEQAGAERITSFLDKYMDAVADNAIAGSDVLIADAAKAQMFDSLLSGMKHLMKQNTISIPKGDRVDHLQSVKDQLQDKLTQLTNENAELITSNKQSLNRSIVEKALCNRSQKTRDLVAESVKDIPIDDLETAISLCISGILDKKTPVHTNGANELTESIKKSVDKTSNYMSDYVKSL